MPVSRRLVAVVVADVVGYSRLMERDEAGTHQRLRTLHGELIAPKIAEHGGRTVKTAGDGMLLEFPSATSALRCAVEIQREMGVRNLYVAPDQRIEFRIGVNLGDIIVEGNDILGDGVNIAARLETLADPGGICVASAIWEQVHEDLGVEFVDAGEQHVKNISKPIHVYRVALGRRLDAKSAAAAVLSAESWNSRVPRRALMPVGAAVLAGAALLGLWHMLRSGTAPAPQVDEPPLRSVMVVPFASGDPELAASAPQLTADVTRALADSMRSVRVTPPKAAEELAAKRNDPRGLGRDANVRFIVEGEARRDAEQIAFALRLVDTRDGKQIESVRKPVARSQLTSPELIVRQLTSATRIMLSGAIGRAAPQNGSAQDLVDRVWTVSGPDQLANTREMCRLADAAIKLDPGIARAWAYRSECTVSLYYLDFSADAASLRERANADSFQAVELDRSDVNGWVARSNALRINGNIKAALEASLTAEKLDPSRFGVLGARGWHYLDAGEPKETLKLVEQLRSLFGTHDSTLAAQACAAQVLLGAYDKAVVECERAESSFDNWNRYANLAAAYAMRGDLAKAEESKRKLMKAVPTFTLASYEARFHPVLPPESAEMDKATYVAGLRKAGVPER